MLHKLFFVFMLFLFFGIVQAKGFANEGEALPMAEQATDLPGVNAPETEEKKHYKVGANDLLIISVLGHDDLKTNVPVATDGTISFPYIGNVNVQGMSLSEIEQEISKRLEGYIKYPAVSVSLSEWKGNNYFVAGEVKNPGRFLLDEDITVLKAIIAAGGITPTGLYGNVKVKRKSESSLGYKEIFIDLRNKKEGDATGDLPVEADDIIIVEQNKSFFVYGEVKNPGKYTLEENITVLKAISLAGGITPEGFFGNVKLKRKQNVSENYKQILIDLRNKKEGDSTGDMPVEADDIIIVERNNDFFVYGEVENPGKFTLEDNMTVLRAISFAGGFTKYGSPDRVKILRPLSDENGYESIDVNLKSTVRGKVYSDVNVLPNDIVIAMEGIF
ncbi:MAG: hypothetical protein E3K37_11210 [Candidatus Kuenenia sp.]|nr:hypothetical protein [Candidatus Kuenenia hertensis]